VVETIANIVHLGLSLVSAVLFLYGLGRKMWLNKWRAYEIRPPPVTDVGLETT
jgi:hypothetical protein